MQRSYFLFLLVLISFSAQSQINEVPIGSNPILQKHAAKEKQRIDNILQNIATEQSPAEIRGGDFLVAEGACLLTGEMLEICIDTVGLSNSGASLNICNTLNFGSASFVADTSCVIYVADAGMAQMGFDSLCIEFCDGSGMCDTTIYPIIVHRSNNTITLSENILNTEDAIQVCVPSDDLPGDFSNASILSTNSQMGAAYYSADCIFYEAQLFAGKDTVVFEVCDNYCVCDTYQIPFTIIGDTLSLPFMDDFSYEGPYPDKTNWLDRKVFVNNNMAINPVSVGVATFDGLDEGGAPIGGGFGVADVLTSAYLDLSSFNSSSGVFFSFYLQPQGLGDAPSGNDSLVVEFKNSNGAWVEIDSYKDTPLAFPDDAFSFFAYPVQSVFLYNGFQFRFKNFSKRTGNIDHWHLDYVQLFSDSNVNPTYRDVAFTQIPNSILKDYSSMPWRHFDANPGAEIQDVTTYSEVHLYNHFDATLEIVPDENQKHAIAEVTSATPVTDDQLLNGTEANILVGNNIINSTPVTNGFSNTQFALETLFDPNSSYLEFERTYTYPKISEESSAVPAVIRNNTVKRKVVFDNYFSYDDNTAETGVEASKKNTQIAVKFHANVADTLKAVQFHFPHIVENTSSQLFNLRVWVGELDDTPEYNGLLQKPLYIDSYTDSINGFTTYVLIDPITMERVPLAIPVGDFYIGWQQVSDCEIFECIAVGVDKNKEGMQNVFVDPTGLGSWSPVFPHPTLTGSLMIRAIVGEGEPQQSSNTDDITTYTRISVFPNPTSGQLNINIENGEHHKFTYFVFNSVGQLLQKNQLTPQVDLGMLQNGIYFVQIMNEQSQQISNHKIIIAK